MRYAALLSTLSDEPLIITPTAHAVLLKLFEEHRTLPQAEFHAKREGTTASGAEVDLPQAEIKDGIMHIPITGPIGSGLGKFEKGAGAVDVGDITDELY